MPTPSAIFKSSIPARTVIFFLVFGMLTYVAWQGFTRFFCESMGTTILITTIIWQLLPSFLKGPYYQLLNHHPILPLLICATPAALLCVALILGIKGFVQGSLRFAVAAFSITLVVFVVYHFVQPLGFSYFNLN